MKGWLLFWVASIAIGMAIGFVDANFDDEIATWVNGIMVVSLGLGVLAARAHHKARVQTWVDELVAQHRNSDQQGIFADWFDQNSAKSADSYRLGEAAVKVMRVYGGRHVINELVNEGYQDVLLDDLADVFGGFRAGQIFGETVGLANKPGFVAMTAAFFLGAFLTHKAMQRR